MKKRNKWVVEELPDESFQGVRVFSVRSDSESEWDAAQVWWDTGKPFCCSCSGPMAAMLSTCVHSLALKRFINIAEKP